MTLPLPFLDRMERLLGSDFPAFAASYDEPRTQGLRGNPLKVNPAHLPALLDFPLDPVPWAPGGFYYPPGARPGRHPYHAAGLYYIQEPSAMAVATVLAPQPGERVLDLCAAPGGKATHLAGLMRNEGLLVANEPHPGRVRILMENLERMGVTCAAITEEQPERLAVRLPGYFDRVLVDAPCSGEGMFRKLPDACALWAPGLPTACGMKQREILAAGVAMLRPGGRLLYSTCTFAPEENEAVILDVLRRHPEMAVVALPDIEGAVPAVPEWGEAGVAQSDAAAIRLTRRLWPHKLRGEGHFIALLQKRESAEVEVIPAREDRPDRRRARRSSSGRAQQTPEAPAPAVDLFRRFAAQYLTIPLEGAFHLFGDALYLWPEGVPDLAGLHVMRVGLHLGDVMKNRFEPSHALALATLPVWVRQRDDKSSVAPEVLAYLRGESLVAAGQKGWTLMTVDGFPLGWAKASDGLLKNHYPKGLRWLGSAAVDHDTEQ